MPIDYEPIISVTDANDEIWFNIINRTITPQDGISIEDVLVQNDGNSRNFGFHIQRYFEDEDLSKKKIKIHYVNSLNLHDVDEVHSIETVGEDQNVLSFKWLINEKVCIEAGTLKFAVEFYDDDGYELNTKSITINITEGLYFTDEIPEPDNWYKIFKKELVDMQQQINEIKNTGGSGGGTVGYSARIVDVSLTSDGWVGDASPYSQVVEIEGVTPYSQVDLTPSIEQLSIFYQKDLAFVTENENGVVTVYALGDKPQNDYMIQATITEVSVG